MHMCFGEALAVVFEIAYPDLSADGKVTAWRK